MGKHGHQLHGTSRLWLLIGLLSALSASASTAIAAEEVENLRADSLCIVAEGDNCATAANEAEIRLEADTLRMRFLDSTAGNTTEDELGNSWSFLVNDPSTSRNAQSYFSFRLRKVENASKSIEGRHVLRIGPSASGSAGAVAIGLDSEFVEGAVSLGTTHVKRRLVHVAAGLQDTTDALTKRQLEDGLLGSVGGIADRLDALEAEVAALEREVGIGGGSGGSSGGGGGGGLMGVPTLVFLAALLGTTWRRRTVAV